MRKLLAVMLFLVLPLSVFADQLTPFSFVTPSTEQDGDTISTAQVSVGVCAGTSCPTLISAAITNKTNRRRCISNASTWAVWLGSNTTTLTSTGFRVSESTGTYPTYCTYNTGAIYATMQTTGTVTVVQDSNSNP